MTLKLIETLKTSIYNPKHTKNKNNIMFNVFENPYFSKNK